MSYLYHTCNSAVPAFRNRERIYPIYIVLFRDNRYHLSSVAIGGIHLSPQCNATPVHMSRIEPPDILFLVACKCNFDNMANFCHCKLRLDDGVVCNFYRNTRHCLLSPGVQHHIPHRLRRVNFRRTTPRVRKNIFHFLPAELSELIVNYMARNAENKFFKFFNNN